MDTHQKFYHIGNNSQKGKRGKNHGTEEPRPQ